MAKVEFLTSHLGKSKKKLPHMPHIVIAGRSNVGKSSLINHLFSNRNLAKTSAKPGKTVTINFFNIDNSYLLVDLPGFGFAAQQKNVRTDWAESISFYLENEENIRGILLLLDIRRVPSEKDFQLIHFASHHNLPIQIIFTKRDKLKKNELKKQIEKNKAALKPTIESFDPILYSIKDNIGKTALDTKISALLWETSPKTPSSV